MNDKLYKWHLPKHGDIRRSYIIQLVLLVMLNTFLYFGFISNDSKWKWVDFEGQRNICAYTLNGYDSYQYVGASSPPMEGLGIIPKGWGTSPWGCILGNLFYPAFLTLKQAKSYFVGVNIILILLTAFCFYREFKGNSKTLALFALFLSIFSANISIAIHCGNAGGIICCLLMLMSLFYDRYPKLAGLLLGIAMVKPQTALPFCITLLFMRQFKILFFAAAVDIMAWLAVSMLVDVPILTLMNKFFNSSIGNNGYFAGIFTIVFLDNLKLAMYLSMISGVIFIYALHRIGIDSEIKFFQFYPACIAVTFWSYAFLSEFHILMIPIFLFLYIMLKSQSLINQRIWFFAASLCSLGPFVFYIMTSLSLALPGFIYVLIRIVFEITIIIFGFVAARYLRELKIQQSY